MYVSEATRKLFSFLFSSISLIKIFTAGGEAIVAIFSTLGRPEPGDQHRVSLKCKVEHQNPEGPRPANIPSQTWACGR